MNVKEKINRYFDENPEAEYFLQLFGIECLCVTAAYLIGRQHPSKRICAEYSVGGAQATLEFIEDNCPKDVVRAINHYAGFNMFDSIKSNPKSWIKDVAKRL